MQGEYVGAQMRIAQRSKPEAIFLSDRLGKASKVVYLALPLPRSYSAL